MTDDEVYKYWKKLFILYGREFSFKDFVKYDNMNGAMRHVVGSNVANSWGNLPAYKSRYYMTFNAKNLDKIVCKLTDKFFDRLNKETE